MLLLLASDNLRATAVALEAKAFNYINPVVDAGPPEVRQDPNTTQWSDIWTDAAQPTSRYAIQFGATVSGAFTDEELGAVRDENGVLIATTNVIEGEQYVAPRRGNPASGEWRISTE